MKYTKIFMVLLGLIAFLMPTTASAKSKRITVVKSVANQMKGPVDLSRMVTERGKWSGAPVKVSRYAKLIVIPAGTEDLQMGFSGLGWYYGSISQDEQAYARVVEETTGYRKWFIEKYIRCGNPGSYYTEEKYCPTPTTKVEPPSPPRKVSYAGTPMSAGIRMTPVDFQPRPASYNVGTQTSTYRSVVTGGYTWINNSNPTCPVQPTGDCHLTPEEAAKIVKPTFGQVTDGVVLY